MRIVPLLLVLCMICMATGAFAENNVTIESKSVPMDGTDITIDVTIANDNYVENLHIPCIVREIDPGSFWREPLPQNMTGLSNESVEYFWDPPTFGSLFRGLEPCNGCEHPYQTAYPEVTAYNAVSPDAFCIVALTLPPDYLVATPEGALRVRLTINVNDVPGRFEIDTAAWVNDYGLFFVDDDWPANIINPSFTKGVITILPSHCPTDPGYYSSSLVEGIAWEILNNPIGMPAWDPDGDPIEYHLVSGPGDVQTSTGEWFWIPGTGDVGQYTVIVEVSDDVLGHGSCPDNHISFEVSIELSDCPDDIGAYTESLVAGLEGDSLYNQIALPAHDPNSNEIEYYLVSGPGVVDLVTGEWTWDPGCGVTGDYTVTVEVTDDMLGEGMCSGNLLSFDVSMAGIPRGDWDCDGKMTPTDVVWMVNYVYRGLGDGPCDPCAK